MSYVIQFDLKLSETLRQGLERQEFSLSQPPYTLFQGKKKGLSVTLYASGKLVVQGKETKEFIEFYLEPEVLGTFSLGYAELDQDLSPHIGVDESGKGDFFGPLCIAGVYGDEETIPELEKIGVKDSKRLKDDAILKLAEKIRKKCPYHLVRIGPKRYNELYEKFGNLNLLLGWGHATVIENMMAKTGCSRIIIDQFAAEHVVETALRRKGQTAELIQRTQGERDLVVAAASILARAAFVEGLSQLEKEMKLKLPKGASAMTIESGRKLVAQYGSQILSHVGKLHFKTAQTILE